MVDMPYNPTQPSHIYLIYIYKEDLALNNLQWLICHEIKPNQIIYIYLIYIYKEDLALNNLQWLNAMKPNPTKSYIFNIYV